MKPIPFYQLSIGNELLYGSTLNSNAREIASRLVAAGLVPTRIEVVADEVKAICSALRRARREARLALLTGGLGSTEDDLTRQAVASYCGVRLVYHPHLYRAIARQVRRRGFPLLPNHARQAFLPQGAGMLRNPCGSAPGFWIKKGRLLILSLPGVPSEALAMLPQVLPLLSRQFGRLPRCRPFIARCYGLTESMLAARVEALLPRRQGLAIEYRVDPPEILLTLRGQSQSSRRAAATLRRGLGDLCYAVGPQSLPERLLALLRRRRQTLATAESCSGGLIGAALTEIPGASAVFLGSAVTYADASKTRLLGVSAPGLAKHGAVSREVAMAMARGARRRFGADFALAVTGIAGPGGGSRQKPVGTVHLALAWPGKTLHRQRHFSGSRERVRRGAVFCALHWLYSYLTRAGRGCELLLPALPRGPANTDKRRQIR